MFPNLREFFDELGTAVFLRYCSKLAARNIDRRRNWDIGLKAELRKDLSNILSRLAADKIRHADNNLAAALGNNKAAAVWDFDIAADIANKAAADIAAADRDNIDEEFLPG